MSGDTHQWYLWCPYRAICQGLGHLQVLQDNEVKIVPSAACIKEQCAMWVPEVLS